jgi:hypothetical protein
MTKIIKKAAIVFPTYTKGQAITWCTSDFDGRGYEYNEYKGIITRVNKITVTAEDTEGNIWSVDKTSIK